MQLYCTPGFKQEFDRLRKNNSYASLEEEIREQYCDSTFEEACSGDLLSASPGNLFIKKRLSGRGGYRVYLLAVVQGENIYLGYVHPKTGKHGADNVSSAKKSAIAKELLAARLGGAVYRVQPDPANPKKLVFMQL